MNFNFKNYSLPFQINLNFLDYNWVMSGIISLHHDIMVYLLLVIISIIYIIFRIYVSFTLHNKPIWSYGVSTPSHILFTKKTLVSNKKYYNNEVLLEIIWTVIPMLLLIFIGLLTISFIYNLCNYIYLPNYTIGVTGHQWYWDYSYNDSNISLESFLIHEDYLLQGELRLLEVDNRLIIPSQSHIRVFITSDDVIHSWAVPSLGIKIDANPGRMNHCHLFINNYISIFYGQCSELCGTGHSLMPIAIQAIPNWLFKLIILFENNSINITDSIMLASIDEDNATRSMEEILRELKYVDKELECYYLNKEIDRCLDLEEKILLINEEKSKTLVLTNEELNNFMEKYMEVVINNDVEDFIQTSEAKYKIMQERASSLRWRDAMYGEDWDVEQAANWCKIPESERTFRRETIRLNNIDVPQYYGNHYVSEFNAFDEASNSFVSYLYEMGFTTEQIYRCEYAYPAGADPNPYEYTRDRADYAHKSLKRHININRVHVMYRDEILPETYKNIITD